MMHKIPPRKAQQHRVNGKFVALLLGVTAVAGLMLVGVHQFQVQRTSQWLQDRADELQSQGDLQAATENYRRVARLVPDHVDALVNLADLLESSAQKADLRIASDALQRLVRLQPERNDYRRRLAHVELALGRIASAEQQVRRLMSEAPEDGELEYLLAGCVASRQQFEAADKLYAAAIQHGYTTVDAFLSRAALLDHQVSAESDHPDANRSWSADGKSRVERILDAMVEANSQSHRSYLARAVYRVKLEKFELALADAQQAEKLAPRDTEVLLALADIRARAARSSGSPAGIQAAREILQRAAQQDPTDARIYQAMVEEALRSGKPDEAIAALRRGQKEVPNWIEANWLTADLLITQGRLAEAKEQHELLKSTALPEEYSQYIEGRMAFQAGRYAAAARKLEALASRVADLPLIAQRIPLHLGRCYARLGRYREQLAQFRLAAEHFPRSLKARLGVASALESLGRPEAALHEYFLLDGIPEARLERARLMLQVQRERPQDERQWNEVADAIAWARQLLPDDPRIELLEAELLAAEEKVEPAQQMLEHLCEQHTDFVEAWTARANLHVRLRQWPQARATIHQARQQLGDRPALRVVAAAYWSHQTQSGEELERLTDHLSSFSTEGQASVLRAVAAIHHRRGDARRALHTWNRLAELIPEHLPTQFRLFSLAQQADDESGQATALGRLRQIEGAQGSHVLALEAMRLIARARENADASAIISRARKHLAHAQALRPQWPLPWLLSAELNQVEGESEEALANLLKAIELGTHDPAAYRTAMTLLMARSRYDEAERLLERLKAVASPEQDEQLSWIVAEVSLRAGDLRTAEMHARRVVADGSRDFREHLWLGQVLVAAGKLSQAKKAFARAHQLAPGEPEPTVALVRLLARMGDVRRAQQVIAAAQKTLSPQQADLALGNCYQALGRMAEAEERFLAARAADPFHAQTLQSLAGLYLQTQRPGHARPILELLIDGADAPERVQAWSRRQLAVGVPARTHADFQRALTLLNENIRQRDDPADLRAKARLLAGLPTIAHMTAAAKCLENLRRQQSETVDDLILLADLYDRLVQVEQARRTRTQLAARFGHSPRAIASIARVHVKRNSPDVQIWVDRLQELAPDNYETAEVSTRLLARRGQSAEIPPLLSRSLELIADPEERLHREVDAALLLMQLAEQWQYEDLGRDLLLDTAEKLLRKNLQARPSLRLQLALLAGKGGQADRALDLCAEAIATEGELPAATAALSVLRSAEPNAERIGRIRRWLEQAQRMPQHAETATLLLASLWDIAAEYERSEQGYRKLLAARPDNHAALNNLALLLTRLGRHEEALPLIEQAIDMAGPLAALLDTRSVIRFHLQDYRAAIRGFRQAIAQAETPTRRLHLAAALWKSGQHELAEHELAGAIQQGLSERQVHRLDRPLYRQLVDALKGN